MLEFYIWSAILAVAYLGQNFELAKASFQLKAGKDSSLSAKEREMIVTGQLVLMSVMCISIPMLNTYLALKWAMLMLIKGLNKVLS